MSKKQRLIIELDYFSSLEKIVEIAESCQISDKILLFNILKEKSYFELCIVKIKFNFKNKNKNKTTFEYFLSELKKAGIKYR